MTISGRNRALLERKFGKSLPPGDPKVTLTVSALAKLLDAARDQGRAIAADPNFQSMLDAVFGKAR